MEDDGNYGKPLWVRENYGYSPEEPPPDYDGALTASDKRNLTIFAVIVVAAVAICCGAGFSLGVLLA